MKQNIYCRYTLTAILPAVIFISACGPTPSGTPSNNTITSTDTYTDTNSQTDSNTATNTDSGTSTDTGTNTVTPTETQTNTSTGTGSSTSTSTNTDTLTNTGTGTQTNTSTGTNTNTGTTVALEITSTPVASMLENSAFTYCPTITGDNGAVLSATLTTAPTFLSLDANNCVSGIPGDADSGATHTITYRLDASDGRWTEQTANLEVINTEDVQGNVSDLFSATSLENVVVNLKTADGTTTLHTATSDASGNYTFIGLTDKSYLVEITDGDVSYFTHIAGLLESNKTKNVEGKLTNINFKIVPKTFEMDFFNETCRNYVGNTIIGAGNGVTQRIPDDKLDTWKVYIDTNNAFGSGASVTQTMIDYVVNIIENDWPILTDGKLNLTIANGGIEQGTIPPAYGTNEYNVHVWNDSGAGSGGHYEYMVGNSVNSSYSRANTSAGIETLKQELVQILGVRWDSNLYASAFNDPLTQTDYNQLDKNVVKLLYNRPIGNTTPDNNPSDYIINP